MEIGHAVVALHDDLAVEHRRVRHQLAGGCYDCRQPVGPVEPVAAVNLDRIAAFVDLHPVAVELEPVLLFVAGWRLWP
jgi:hypothetical protein